MRSTTRRTRADHEESFRRATRRDVEPVPDVRTAGDRDQRQEVGPQVFSRGPGDGDAGGEHRRRHLDAPGRRRPARSARSAPRRPADLSAEPVVHHPGREHDRGGDHLAHLRVAETDRPDLIGEDPRAARGRSRTPSRASPGSRRPGGSLPPPRTGSSDQRPAHRRRARHPRRTRGPSLIPNDPSGDARRSRRAAPQRCRPLAGAVREASRTTPGGTMREAVDRDLHDAEARADRVDRDPHLEPEPRRERTGRPRAPRR